MDRAYVAVFGVAVLWLLNGCAIPFAYSHHVDPGSRDEISASTASALEVGRTTRLDVLWALGEPDGRAADDSWFTYGSERSKGAGLALAPGLELGPSKEQVSRTVILFDHDGVVSKAEFQQSACGHTIMPLTGRCLDIRGSDLADADKARARAEGKGKVLAQSDAQVRNGTPTHCGFNFHTPYSYEFLIVTDRMIIVGPEEISYVDLAEVLPPWRQELDDWIAIRRKNGLCSFIFISSDKKETARVHELIAERFRYYAQIRNESDSQSVP